MAVYRNMWSGRKEYKIPKGPNMVCNIRGREYLVYGLSTRTKSNEPYLESQRRIFWGYFQSILGYFGAYGPTLWGYLAGWVNFSLYHI